MGLTYSRNEIVVITDPSDGQALTIDPTKEPGSLSLASGGREIVIPLADPAVITRLQEQIGEAFALESGPVESRVGWTARDFSPDDAFFTSYTEGEVDPDGAVIEGTFTVSGPAPSGLSGSVNDLSLGVAIGLRDELNVYLP